MSVPLSPFYGILPDAGRAPICAQTLAKALECTNGQKSVKETVTFLWASTHLLHISQSKHDYSSVNLIWLFLVVQGMSFDKWRWGHLVGESIRTDKVKGFRATRAALHFAQSLRLIPASAGLCDILEESPKATLLSWHTWLLCECLCLCFLSPVNPWQQQREWSIQVGLHYTRCLWNCRSANKLHSWCGPPTW